MAKPIFAATIREDADGTLIFEPLPPICIEYGRGVHQHTDVRGGALWMALANDDCTPYIFTVHVDCPAP